MIQIIINEKLTNIKTNDIEILIEGKFELKKEGAEAPKIKIISEETYK